MAHNTTTVVIGAGHAGLAMSHWLSTRSIDHVLLEATSDGHCALPLEKLRVAGWP